MKQGFVIPVYRHGKTAGPLAEKLAATGLPVIMIDDGNDDANRNCLEEWAARIPGLVLIRLEKNMGKGRAVAKGFEKARELGLTHVFQIDADAQHDAGQIAFFLEESRRRPDEVICGFPEFSADAPRSRVIGRKISTFWAAVSTLSTELKDVLCGFRVYPLEPALPIFRSPFFSGRMDFDAEILVRLYWKKVFPVFYPVRVSYPEDGISNFHVVLDNLRISWMFTRLFFGMLLRLPLLILIKIRRGKTRR